MQYRKKPVVIEAWPVEDLLRAASRDWESLPKQVADAYERGDVLFVNHPSRMEVQTLEGRMTASEDDWLIQGIQGELYPCKPGIFGKTYEPVS